MAVRALQEDVKTKKTEEKHTSSRVKPHRRSMKPRTKSVNAKESPTPQGKNTQNCKDCPQKALKPH